MTMRANSTPDMHLAGANPGRVVAPINAHNNLVTRLDATEVGADRAPVAPWETATPLNLRSELGTDSAVLTTLPKGTSVRSVGDKKDEWY